MAVYFCVNIQLRMWVRVNVCLIEMNYQPQQIKNEDESSNLCIEKVSRYWPGDGKFSPENSTSHSYIVQNSLCGVKLRRELEQLLLKIQVEENLTSKQNSDSLKGQIQSKHASKSPSKPKKVLPRKAKVYVCKQLETQIKLVKTKLAKTKQFGEEALLFVPWSSTTDPFSKPLFDFVSPVIPNDWKRKVSSSKQMSDYDFEKMFRGRIVLREGDLAHFRSLYYFQTPSADVRLSFKQAFLFLEKMVRSLFYQVNSREQSKKTLVITEFSVGDLHRRDLFDLLFQHIFQSISYYYQFRKTVVFDKIIFCTESQEIQREWLSVLTENYSPKYNY